MNANVSKKGLVLLDITRAIDDMIYKKTHSHFAIFNPSICRIPNKPGQYLVSYRITGNIDRSRQNAVTNSRNSRHPWPNNWQVQIDGTGFAILIMNSATKPTLKNIDAVAGTIQQAQFPGVFANGILLKFVDLRLFTYNDQIWMTFNTFTNTDNPPLGLYKNEPPSIFFGGDMCNKNVDNYFKMCTKEWCGNIAVAVCSFNNGALQVNNVEYACPKCSRRIEKNWTLYKNAEGRLNISYGISGVHTILRLNDNDVKKCTTEVISSVCTKLLDIMYNKYGLIFSLSTPAVPWDDKNSLLAVGHAKIEFTKLLTMLNSMYTTGLATNTARQLATFTKFIELKAGSHNFHRNYAYFMYFYRLDNISGEIIQISDLFIPYKNEQYSVYFPCGLELVNPNFYLLSYGVGDVQSKILLINRQEISNLFINTDLMREMQLRFLSV